MLSWNPQIHLSKQTLGTIISKTFIRSPTLLTYPAQSSTNQPNARGRVLLEKLVVSQPVKKFSAFMISEGPFCVLQDCTTGHHVSQLNPVYILTPYFFSSILILPTLR
jgi:hypothetical protein